MTKILATAAATLVAVVSLAATSVPATAGNFNFSFGVYGPGPGWGPGWGGWGPGGVVVVNPGGNYWQAHVNWCYSHKGPSYNPQTNTYVSNSGKVKYCDSPYI
jgi:hypothetical protein